MIDVEFDHLEYFHLLWLIPVLAGVYAYGFYRKHQALRVFATANLFGQLMPRVSTAKQKLKAALVLAAIVCLILAATGPRWGKDIVEVQRRGVDVIVALDVSRSMLAEDLAPNRLERAKLELGDMLSVMAGDRVGLVTFAGKPVSACPLTINYGAFRMTLDEVTTRSSPRGGTLIGDAVRAAADCFTDQVKGHKAILVITDGEDQESMPIEAAASVFEDRGIRVFTVGLGNAGQGARIPIGDDGNRQFLQHDGQEVWSKMDAQTLREMAVKGGGAYFGAETRNVDFTEVYDRIRSKVESREFETDRKELYIPRYQWFAGLGLLLLILEILITDRKSVAAEPALTQD